jgi:hypothetical protein
VLPLAEWGTAELQGRLAPRLRWKWTMSQDESNYEYDFAFSFPGEDREIVDKVAAKLRLLGVPIFYDRYETAALWGKDLYQHLQHVYRDQARFCVVFVSANKARRTARR